jgi:hypothetical protein
VSASKFPLLGRQNCPNSDWIEKLRCRLAVAARVSMLRGVSFLTTAVMVTSIPLLREGGVDAT